MSLTLKKVVDAREAFAPSARLKELRDANHSACATLFQATKGDLHLKTLVDAVFGTSSRVEQCLEQQEQRWRRTLKRVLALDETSDEARAIVLTELGLTHRDAKILSEGEANLVAKYRELDTAARATINAVMAAVHGHAPCRRDGGAR